ncbi:hypothetical protein CIB48_g2624 [Xylaria polymorpha]|nr:hypothetical protein CIB48_g2624 [Xylaria polymorpha]
MQLRIKDTKAADTTIKDQLPIAESTEEILLMVPKARLQAEAHSVTRSCEYAESGAHTHTYRTVLREQDHFISLVDPWHARLTIGLLLVGDITKVESPHHHHRPCGLPSAAGSHPEVSVIGLLPYVSFMIPTAAPLSSRVTLRKAARNRLPIGVCDVGYY